MIASHEFLDEDLSFQVFILEEDRARFERQLSEAGRGGGFSLQNMVSLSYMKDTYSYMTAYLDVKLINRIKVPKQI